MNTHKFNSNIKCINCETTVRKVLDSKEDIIDFKVDLNDPKREVVITSNESISEKQLITWVHEAGFKLEGKSTVFQKLFKKN